jgi:hypothetical protein
VSPATLSTKILQQPGKKMKIFKVKRYFRVFLGLDNLPPSHTAEVVKTHLKKILSVYKITDESIFAYITDNGSNVVCAFKDDYEG